MEPAIFEAEVRSVGNMLSLLNDLLNRISKNSKETGLQSFALVSRN